MHAPTFTEQWGADICRMDCPDICSVAIRSSDRVRLPETEGSEAVEMGLVEDKKVGTKISESESGKFPQTFPPDE